MLTAEQGEQLINDYLSESGISGSGVSSDLNKVVDSILKSVGNSSSFGVLTVGESNNTLMNNMNNINSFIGNMTGMYNSALASECEIIYKIAATINEMDANMANQAMNLNDGMNIGAFSNDLGTLLNSLNSNVLDFSNINLEETLFSNATLKAERTGNISTNDIDVTLSSLKTNLNTYKTEATNTKNQISSFQSMYGSVLKGAIWDQVNNQLDLFDNVLQQQTATIENITKAVEEAFNELKAYMSPYDSLDDSKIPEIEQQIDDAKASIEALKASIEAEKAKGHYEYSEDDEGNRTEYWVSDTDWEKINGWLVEIDNYQTEIEVTLQPLLDKLKGLAEAVATAERKINEAIIDSYNNYGQKLEGLYNQVSGNTFKFNSYNPSLLETASTKNYDLTTFEGRVNYIYNQLTEVYGYSDAAARAIMANMANEHSDMDPESGRGTYYIGLCTWEGDRDDKLKDWCNEKGYDPYSIDGQLAFMQHELTSSGYKWYDLVYEKLMDDNVSFEDKTKYFCTYYEAPAIDNGGARTVSEQTQAVIAVLDSSGVGASSQVMNSVFEEAERIELEKKFNLGNSQLIENQNKNKKLEKQISDQEKEIAKLQETLETKKYELEQKKMEVKEKENENKKLLENMKKMQNNQLDIEDEEEKPGDEKDGGNEHNEEHEEGDYREGEEAGGEEAGDEEAAGEEGEEGAEEAGGEVEMGDNDEGEINDDEGDHNEEDNGEENIGDE